METMESFLSPPYTRLHTDAAPKEKPGSHDACPESVLVTSHEVRLVLLLPWA